MLASFCLMSLRLRYISFPILLFSLMPIFLTFFVSITLFFILLFFQTDAEPISIYYPMSEEAHVDASASDSVASIEGTIP